MMLIQQIKKISSEKFIRNIGWLGLAELIQRVFRLATTVTLAHLFTPRDYGMVSAIYTVFEFANTFSLKAGIGAKIIQADEADLKDICNTAYWLNWILCSSLFIIQCLCAYPIAMFYRNEQLILPIITLGLIYLIFPLFLVRYALIERENRLEVIAFGNATQAILSNIIIVALAIKGMGVWAVVLSMVVTYPVWIIITHTRKSQQSWQPSKVPNLKRWREIAKFGSKSLGVDLLIKLRMNLDYLLIARFLGSEALGIYFFAFNAGLGISQSILYGLSSAWYPHFCQARSDIKLLKKRFFGSFKAILLVVVPLVIFQTNLAPFYVPIIFGHKWVTAIPLLVLICCCAIPIALSNATTQLLQAVDKINIDIAWNLIFTLFFAIGLFVAVPNGIYWVAVTVLATQLFASPIFTIWVTRFIFRER
jgi:teichuronic acid exporter